MMSLEHGKLSIDCDRKVVGERQYCIAAVTISNHLIGVWPVWESEAESADGQVERKGRAMVALQRMRLFPRRISMRH